MATHKSWWCVFYDCWKDYQSLQERDNINFYSNEPCDIDPKDCIDATKISFILRLYSRWITHQHGLLQQSYVEKIEYLSNKIKQRANKPGVSIYYLHKACVYTKMREYRKAINVIHLCMELNTNHIINLDTVHSLYAILLCCTNRKEEAIQWLQEGQAVKGPGTRVSQLLDKLNHNHNISLSDLGELSVRDGGEHVDYSEIHSAEGQQDETLMNHAKRMIDNRDGIPIIYFVLRVLYNIVEFPSNNKVRQLNIQSIKKRTTPYDKVAVEILIACGFERISHNNKQFVVLRSQKHQKDVESALYCGNKMNEALLGIPLLELVEGLKDFRIEDIMSNYHHICLNHNITTHSMLDTLNYFECDANNGICKASECCILQRLYRHAEHDSSQIMRKHHYYGVTESSQVFFMQLLDEMHAFIYHSLSLFEYEHFAQNALKKTMKRLSELCCVRSVTEQQYRHSDDDDDDEDEQEYFESKTSEFRNYQRDSKNNKQLMQCYLEPIPKHHDTTKFVDNYHQMFDVPPHIHSLKPDHQHLKQEILNNKIYKISINEWQDVARRCLYLSKTRHCRTITPNKKNNGIFDHLSVLFIWTKYPKLQIAVKQCNINTMQWIAHFMQLLHGCVSIYGQEIESTLLYHTFNDGTILNGCQIDMHMPFSCTSSFAVAEMASSRNGIVVTFSKYQYFKHSLCFDLKWISPFCAEREVLVYGEHSKLTIVNIMDAKRSMEPYAISNILFFYIWNGNNIKDLHLLHYQNNATKRLLNMLKTFRKENINTMQSRYHQLWFEAMLNHLIQTKKAIFIDQIQNKYLDKRLMKYITEIKRQHNIPSYTYKQESYHIRKEKLNTFNQSLMVPLYVYNNQKGCLYVKCNVKMKTNEQNEIEWWIQIEHVPSHNSLYNQLCFRWRLDIAVLGIHIDSILDTDEHCKGSMHCVVIGKHTLKKMKLNMVDLTVSIVCRSYRLTSNNCRQINQDPKLL
eukprot:271284_1